jgi:MgsA AAA+ ATPase C terminal
VEQTELNKIGDQVAESLSEVSQYYEDENYSVSMANPNSKYKLSSALQKCIRRGLAEKAVYYAQAIFNGGEADYLWRRLPIIALEDVGVADIMLCAQTLHFCRFSAVRKSLGEKKVLSYLVHTLASGAKNRTLCDLLCSVYFMPNKLERYQSQVQGGAYSHAQDKNVQSKTMMDMLHLGWPIEGVPEMLGLRNPVKGALLMDNLLEEGGPIAAYAAHAGQKKNAGDLHLPLFQAFNPENQFLQGASVITQELPDPVYLQGVPDWSFDQHTLDGKRAIGYLMKSSNQLKKWSAHTGVALTSDMVNMILFQTESAKLNKQLSSVSMEQYQAFNDELESDHVSLIPGTADSLRGVLNTDDFKEELLHARKRVLNLV